jgi:hypothetical protein
MSLWDSIKDKALQVGSAAGVASQKTKLRTEILLVDRELKARQQAFGIQLYDYVAPLARTPNFFACDDMLTSTLRPPLLTAQREIAALEIKASRQKGLMSEAEVKRKGAFPVPASNWQEKLTNAGRSTAMAGSEAKLKTELSMLEIRIKSFKQQFGLDLYLTLEALEDSRGWLPTDREIRSLYDSCRKDMEHIKLKKTTKQQQLHALGGGFPDTNTNTNTNTDNQQQEQQQTRTNASMEYADPFASPAADPFASPPASAPTPPYSDGQQSQSQYAAPQFMGTTPTQTQTQTQQDDLLDLY